MNLENPSSDRHDDRTTDSPSVPSVEGSARTPERRGGMTSKEDVNRDYAELTSTRVSRLCSEIKFFARHEACLALADRSARQAVHASWRTQLDPDVVAAYRDYVSNLAGPVALVSDALGEQLLARLKSRKPDLASKDLRDVYRDRARIAAHDLVSDALREQPGLAADVPALRHLLETEDGMGRAVDALVRAPRNKPAKVRPTLTHDQRALCDALVGKARENGAYIRHVLRKTNPHLTEQDVEDLEQETYAKYYATLVGGTVLSAAFDTTVEGTIWRQRAYVIRIAVNRCYDWTRGILGPNGRPREVVGSALVPVADDQDGEEVWDPADSGADPFERMNDFIDLRRLLVRAAEIAGQRALTAQEPIASHLRVGQKYLLQQAGSPSAFLDPLATQRDGQDRLRVGILAIGRQMSPELLGPDASPSHERAFVKAVVTRMRECIAAAGSDEGGE
jgi:DNA-directed RNA polymerase specialized sigma24 family protein